ncbi:MAG TPA: SpoIID/LytB domain-containing protein [Actinomycetota bacterium]|nr:SpoIID/LytB domain-containing protein [Actinomycetota bacterium]
MTRQTRTTIALALLALLALIASACSTTAPGNTAVPSASNHPSQPSSGTKAAPPSSPVATPSTPAAEQASDTTRVNAPPGGTLLVHGAYPKVPSRCVRYQRPRLAARYPGALSVRRSDDGTLSLTLTLPFEDYLEGIAEVPSSWPRAALEAQAIAARSYALASTGWEGSQGETLKTPICATTSCQVYRGIPVPFDPTVRRWFGAVRRTVGQVLLYEGRPADTVYFSTSNGHTYGNDAVFGSAPLPYLRPVVERDDGASPLSHWRVRLPFGDVARFLHEAAEWPAHRSVTGVRLDGSTVTVQGDGHERSMDLTTFRDAINEWGPCLAPDRYPPSPLPVTLPSRWMTMSSGPDAALAVGRGWGHGVGMVQWGAYGKARRGLSASQILAYYYGGLRPETYPEPGLIHVQVASGLTSIRVVPSGTGATVEGQPLDAPRVTIAGGDELSVTPGT